VSPPADAELQARLVTMAAELARRNGWTWLGPVNVKAGMEKGEPAWIVESHYRMRGVNVVVVFRRSDLAVLRSGWLPR